MNLLENVHISSRMMTSIPCCVFYLSIYFVTDGYSIDIGKDSIVCSIGINSRCSCHSSSGIMLFVPLAAAEKFVVGNSNRHRSDAKNKANRREI